LARDLRTVEVNAEQKIVKQNRQHAEQRADHLDAWRYAVNGRDVQRWIKETQKRK
jgi:hypothetical protein